MGELTILDNGKETDIVPLELKRIEKFKEDGMPGLGAVVDVVLAKALDLYLGGKTYNEIAGTLKVKKDIVLFLAHKFNWYGTKMEHMQVLDANIKERLLHAKLVNQDFLLQIQQFFQQKIGKKISRYMATGDEEIANKVDGKDIDRFNKAVELLDKISSEKIPLNNKTPALGLNLGDGGVDIRRVNENEITITPRNKTVGEMLNELANIKRKEEEVSKNSVYDITKESEETDSNN